MYLWYLHNRNVNYRLPVASLQLLDVCYHRLVHRCWYRDSYDAAHWNGVTWTKCCFSYKDKTVKVSFGHIKHNTYRDHPPQLEWFGLRNSVLPLWPKWGLQLRLVHFRTMLGSCGQECCFQLAQPGAGVGNHIYKDWQKEKKRLPWPFLARELLYHRVGLW